MKTEWTGFDLVLIIWTVTMLFLIAVANWG